MAHKKRQLKKRLKEGFGEVKVSEVRPGVHSATVPGFAAYGRNNLLLSRSGKNPRDALINLFDQLRASAVKKGEFKHPISTSHVYDGDRQEVVFDPGKQGFEVTPYEYSDQLGF